MGLQSLPVAFGVDTAKWICVASIDLTQAGIAAWLYSIGETTYAAILAAFILPQVFAQFKVSFASTALPLLRTCTVVLLTYQMLGRVGSEHVSRAERYDSRAVW